MTADLVEEFRRELEKVLGPGVTRDEAERLLDAGRTFHARRTTVEPVDLPGLITKDAIRLARARAVDRQAGEIGGVIAGLLLLYRGDEDDGQHTDAPPGEIADLWSAARQASQKFAHDPYVVDDLTSDTVNRVMPTFDASSTAWGAYLRAAAAWAAADRRRRLARRKEQGPLDDDSLDVADPAQSVENHVIEAESNRELTEAIVRFLGTVGTGKALSERQRRQLLEDLRGGATHEQIARALWIETHRVTYMVQRLRPFVEEWLRNQSREE